MNHESAESIRISNLIKMVLRES